MKAILRTGVMGLAMLATLSSPAQLKGLINKAKDRVNDIKSITGSKKNSNGNPENTNTNSGNSRFGNNGSGVSLPDKVTITEQQQDVVFEFCPNGGSFGGFSYTVQQLENEKPIGPYRHIRKKGESGNFHFAKDYPELKNIAEPEIANASLIFSSTPFNKGASKPAGSFSSASGYIYARLETKGRSIKEALQIGGQIPKLKVDLYFYPDGGDEIWNKDGNPFAFLYLNEELMSKSTIDFDIRPSVATITANYNPRDRYSYYLPPFALVHTQEFFPKSGKYKIGVRVVSDIYDEWGKNTYKQLEVAGNFDYEINAKEAPAIFEEGQQVVKALQTGMRKLPKPLPAQWKMNSAASVVPGYSVAKYNQLYQGFYKDVKIVKTVLIPAPGAAWKVVSNDNIVPTYKYCTQTVYFFVKDKEGNCYYHPCDLRQDYSGGGTYGPMHLAVFDEERVYVKCEEMK
jgi:hypothetical protein